MAKVIAVLYPDPVDGYPKKYARDDIPKITKYPDGQTAPTPSAIDFKPGELLGSSPANSVFASSWRRPATPWWSHRAKTARARCSIESCPTQKS
jgi:hypothetical protein